MKKVFSIALIFLVFSLGACKKSEEKPENQTTTAKTTEPKQKKKRQRPAPTAAALEIFDEDNLVGTIAQDDYAALSTSKIKVGKNKNREVDAVLLSDLLKKYNVTGKNVILAGPRQSALLSWQQATASPIYVFQGARNQFQLSNQGENLTDVVLPGKLIKITVSEKSETVSTPAGSKKPAT